jgi:predicted RNA-binding protein with RPS1 domain
MLTSGLKNQDWVHISRMTHGYVKSASDVVNVGDEVEVKILDFNRRKRQIKLSMRAMEPEMDAIEGLPSPRPQTTQIQEEQGGAENKEPAAPASA